MKIIDSINARPDANGIGKVGFSDNADLSGQDATYLTPDWLNHLQEELCNLIELNGISLNADSKQQLFNLLTTQSELVALSDAIESNFIRKSQKGAANGVAPLNVQSIIDSSFLPTGYLSKIDTHIPYAAATPIAGAPLTLSLTIASIISSISDK